MMPSRARIWSLRYGGAVVAVGLAASARWVLAPYTGGRQPQTPFYFAVILVSWFGGLGPSILAVVLSVAAVTMFVPPSGPFRLHSAADLIWAAMFIGVCSAVVGFAEAGRRARRRLEREAEERSRAEEALRASEFRLRQLADTMPQIVWTAVADGSVDYFNARFYEYTGTAPESALILEGWRAIIHPDDLPGLAALRDEAVHGGDVFEAEARLRDRSGGYRWHLLRSVPVRDESGGLAQRFGTATDIDDRRRSEEALRAADRRKDELLASLRESEDTFRTLADTIPQLAWMARPDGHIFWYNRRCYDYTGAAFEEIEGWGWESILDPTELPRVVAKFKAAIEAGEPWEDTFPIRRRDGALRWHLSRALPLRDDQGRIVRWFGTNTDVTEQREMERALRDADRRKDEFLALLAHELRNPLAPIRNALRLMARPEGPSNVDEPDRAMAERQVVHLARLVDDLMDVSRITTGKIELRKEAVDLGAVARRAVEAIGATIEARGHAFEVSLPEGPIPLEADPTRLEQVFWNLLSNAAKYTDPGGRIRFSAAIEDGEATVRVEDTGIGIEPAMLARVFEMFVQADDREGGSQGGLGLGLSLVRSLVAMHGGRVEAQSGGPGRGATFVVRLPVARASPREPATAPLIDGRPPRRRVLVVDDNVDAAVSLGRVLSRIYGQDVRLAHDGPSALREAEDFRPEVVLLDIGMPGMDGHEVARRLRARPESGRALLVALTGWGQESDRQKSRQAGIDHHLVKPVAPETLRDILAARGGPAVVA